jgi:DNA gyrase/topoisomerase IV subunit B
MKRKNPVGNPQWPGGMESLSPQEHMRKRPGMYFGASGREGVPKLFLMLINGVLRLTPIDYKGPIEVSITRQADDDVMQVLFKGLTASWLPAAHPETWVAGLAKPEAFQLNLVPMAGSVCVLECSDGKRKGSLRWSSGNPGKARVSASTNPPFMRFRLRPDREIFHTAGHNQLYQMAGILRDFCLLRPGLAATFRSDVLGKEIRYFYKQGMKSYLMEADYQRFPLHPGYLGFQLADGDTKVECFLRFVHAGSAQVRSYVNFHPTQGGTHLEGLGMALKELCGPEARGCRDILFLTNPDTGKQLFLPWPFIGVLHFQTPEPRYRGPTKDILDNTEATDFVYRAAKTQLRGQWNFR